MTRAERDARDWKVLAEADRKANVAAEARIAELEEALQEIESAPWSSLDAFDVLREAQAIARVALDGTSDDRG